MNVRVVVADERTAIFFDAPKYGALLACGSLENPAGGLKDRELETDRPGRRFGGTSGVRHGVGVQGGHHHGVDGERSTERHELTLFAKEVAQRIDQDRVKHEFDRLVIVAGPRMLGLLRQELPATCKGVIVGEIPKDLTQHDLRAVREVLPPDAFFQ
jgi:protein required for attachment to host cells